MTLIGEPCPVRHLAAGDAVGQQPAREIDSQPQLKAMRRDAEVTPECPREMPRRQAGDGGNLFQANARGRVGGDVRSFKTCRSGAG